MGESGSQRAPEGVTVDDVDWLPSGARSGIVRVQGTRPADATAILPRLVVTGPEDERTYDSLPDTATASGDGWRGAYVVEAAVALAATSLTAVWPSGERWALGTLGPGPATAEAPDAAPPHLSVVQAPPEVEPSPAAAPGPADDAQTPGTPAPADAAPSDPGAASAGRPAPPEPDDAGADVVDRAVLAERRAGRAEAAAKIHADMARNAMHAIEALELRSAALAQDLEAARAERDTLRARTEPRVPAEPSPRESALERALAERQAEVDALRAETAAQQPDDEAERRAAALTQALTEAVAEVDGLRAELHEQLVLRRTRDVEAAADRVALVTLVRDLDGLRAATDAARAEATQIAAERDSARVALEHQRAETAGAHAAHDETRRRFTERVAELREARQRIGILEAELAAARDEATRVQAAHAAELSAVREAAETAALAAAERLGVAQAEAARNAEQAAEVDAMRAEVARADAALRRAETAREAALASALAARAQRQAAAVATAGTDPARVAALEAELAAVRAQLAEATGPAPAADAPPPSETAQRVSSPQTPGPVAAPADVIARAAEQVRLAAERRAATPPPPGRLVADLEAAAAALRDAHPQPAAAPDPPDEAGAEDAEAPADRQDAERGPADAEPAPAPVAPRRRPTITPGPAALPGDLARGQGRRTYPPLRGGLVKLAHDDPEAAARLLAGLATGLRAALDEPTTLDLTLDELDGTLALDVTADRTTLETVGTPRGRSAARIAVSTNAVTLAETLAGVGHRPRRHGVLRATRGRRRARRLLRAVTGDATLPDLVRAGADLEPALALRAFAYAVPPAWTRGETFAVRITVDGVGVLLRARDGGGLAADDDDGPAPDAEISMDRAGFHALLAAEGPPASPYEHVALTALREWARRLGVPPA